MIGRLLHFWDEERSLSALLILLIIEVFVIMPIPMAGHALGIINLFVFPFLLLAGLLTMSRRRTFQMVAAVFVFSAISVRLSRSVFGVSGLFQLDVALSILSVLGMIFVVLWQVYREGPVTGHRVRGAIVVYLLIAIMFAFCYTLIASIVPGSFRLTAWMSPAGPEQAEEFFYFSVVALTTVGFGDITAIHPVARSLVMLEALIGQLYPAILIARLITLELETRKSRKDK